MKKFKILVILAIVGIFSSCTSDSDASSSTDQYFNFNYDNQQINVDDWTAIRSENSFAVTGNGSNGETISFEFNANGNIGEVNTYSTSTFTFPDSQAQKYYTNESFNFELVSLNEAEKTVQVNYSGKVYEDGYDLTSNFVTISGSFLVKYSTVTPTVPGLGMYAKLNSDDWYSASSDQTGGFFSGEDIYLDSYNGGIYKMGVTVNHMSTTVGSYSFTPSSTTNKVMLSKYNSTIDYFQEYACTGTLKITSKQIGSQITVISGTYDFVATDPETNEQVTVTSGKFKDAYTNY